jgi:peptidoglycan/xylan/chitin deacetylase (PgdA/CDA1 family)
VESYPEDVKAILAAGHDLGNHSENHKNMSQLGTEEMKTELLTVHEKVKNLTGYEMTLFRPPYGDYSNEVIQTATSLGYYSIQWDVDSLVTHGMGLSHDDFRFSMLSFGHPSLLYFSIWQLCFFVFSS